MKAQLETLLEKLEANGRPGIKNSIAISWICYDRQNPKSINGSGTNWNGSQPFYPASIVKIIYALAIEAWLQKDLIPESKELRRAMKDMIAFSSNDATGIIVDLLTGTTSGPSLLADRWDTWKEQRQLINKWLNEFGWDEFAKSNCCQKTWGEGPYGRESDFYKAAGRNALSTNGVARTLEGIMTNALVSPPACKRLRALLSRSINPSQRESDPENQVDEFLGAGFPKGTQLWSKAGLMSQARHDAAWCCPPGGMPMLLVVFSNGAQRAKDKLLLPYIAKELIKLHQKNN